MADDFFVRFGSDAAAFGRKLDQDLAGARRTISTFTRQLADIETTAANRRAGAMKHLAAMSAEADRVQKKIDAIGAASGAAGVNPEVADLQQMARAAYQDIGQIVSGMDAVLLRLKGAADTIDRFDTNLAAERTRQNRSAGQTARTDQVRDPASGRVTSGEGVPFRQQDLQRLITQAVQAGASATPVSISQIPQATIDEAAFQRVVTAVERNVTATERVEAAIDRLGGRIGTGDVAQVESAVAPAAQAAAAEAVAVAQQQQGPSRRTQQLDRSIEQLTARDRALRLEIERLAGEMQEGAEVSAVFGRNLAELAEVEKRLASARQARASEESRAEQQERQRRAAQREAAAQAGITISPEERRFRQDERARLELAANPEQLRGLVGRGPGQLGKAGLDEIAQTLSRQGYPVDLGARRADTGLPRASVEKMIEQITAAGREYLATGRATADDLSARRIERQPAQLSTDVQNLLQGDLPRVAQRFTREMGRLGLSVEQAYQLIGQSMRSGGQDPREVRRRGRLEVGAEIGDELRDSVRAAPDIISAYDRERRAAARGDVLAAMRGNQQFNPYELDLKTAGRDQAAQQARRDVAALLRATQEIDQFASGLGDLDDGLRRAQQVQARVLRALDAYERLERQPTSDESAEYTRNLARAEQASRRVAERRARLEQEMSLFSDPTGGNAQFMLEPGFREGVRRRQESRERAEAEAEAARTQSQERFLGRQALRDATFEYMGRARIFATPQGNTTDYFQRTLPGVRSAGTSGRQRFAFTDEEMMRSPENRRALGQMTAGILGYTRRLNELIDEVAEGDRTEAQLNETRSKVIQALSRMLTGYMTAFPSGQAPELQKFLPPQLFGGQTDLDAIQAINPTSAAETRRREAQVQANIDDLAAQEQALRDRERAARRRSGAAGGSGDGGGTPPPTAAGADEPSGRQGILQQILAALNRIDGRLKGTIRVSGTVDTREGVAGAPAVGGTRTARSTAQGRADFEASIAQTIPAVGQLLGAGNDIEAAAEMVARGVMSETRVLDLFRDKLQQSAQEAKEFQAAVRGAAGDRRLAEAAAAAEEQRSKLQAQQFQTRGGESMSIAQARTAMREDLSARKRREDQQRRTTSEERQAAAAALVHAQALSRLSQETKAEIALLERMARETDDSAEAHERLAAQMAKVYGMTAQNMRGRSTETNQAAGQIFKGAGIDVTGEEVTSMRNTARSLGYQVDHSAAQGVMPGGLFGEQSEFTQALFGNTGFWSRVMNSTGTFIVRNFTAGFVFGMTNALQELLTQAIQAEAIFVRVSDALEETGQSSEGLRSDLRGLAVEYGVSLQGVYESAAQLTGLFDNADDLVGGVEVVTMMQRISMGALTSTESVGVLAATIGGFGAELDTAFGGDRLAGMTHVLDVLTSIQNNLGVNLEVSSEGVGRMAGLAQSLNLSFEDAAVYVSQIAKLTNQTGAAAGEQFSRVLGAMQTGRGRQVLIDSLPTSGIEQQLASGQYGDVLQTLLKNWDNLTEAQQRNITVTLGGQRQAAALGALFNDSAHVLEATARAHDANGDAARRNEEIMQTMNAQVGVLMGNFTALADNLLDSGIANSIGVILVMVNKLLSGLNWLLNGINDLSESNSFTKVLLEWGAGLAGFLVLLTLLGKSLAGAKASMAAMRGFAIGENVSGEATRPAWSTITGAPAAAGSRAAQASTNAATRAGAAFAAGNNAAAASHLAVSKAAGVAARASNGVAAGMSRVASAGLTAQIGLALAAAGIITLITDVTAARNRDKQFREQYDKQYGEDGQAGTGDEGDPYVGPFSEGMQANRAATLTYGGNFKSLFTAPFRAGNMTNGRSWTDLGFALDRIQGLVPDDQQEDLDQLHFDALSRIKEQIQMPVQTAESVQATNDEVADMLSRARDDIMSSDLSDQQKQAALAEIEQYAVGFDGIITKLRLKAEGVTALDELTTDQINEISEISQLLAANASLGNADVASLGADLVGNLGLNEDSGIYKRLQRLAQGGISSAESLKIQAANVSLELKNAQEKYNTILTGGETEEGQLAAQRQLVLSKAAELVQLTEARLQALISDANTIAELRASRGNFAGAGAAIEAALNKFRAERSDNESNVTRAANNLIEAQGAEQIANQIAAGQNAQLEASKARGVGALESAQIDAEIASNTYQALLAQRRAAQEAGREGPSIRAIRDAKNAWLSAQRQAVLEAQNASIAQLTLAAASEWNALAAGQIQEQIAMQQYADAVKNFGAGSNEALAAQTTLVNQQKQNQQTQDQVAAAQRDAMLASIPRGNTLAIARQTLANAQAAVAAAAKYGQNSTEYQGALAQLYAAQQGLVQTEADLIQSRTAIAIALAQASGNTVKASLLQVRAARQALQAALQNSGGAESAEVNQARAQVISAEAAARDARLQDQLDTIDFNLQMGRITQSSAISALRQILRTQDLTKAQRRQLLLQIKGMQESLSDSQWNFGDIKMPTPYQMRRYIEKNRNGLREAQQQVGAQFQDAYSSGRPSVGAGGGGSSSSVVNNNHQTTITINANRNLREVEEVVKRAVGKGHRVRTAQPRRR